MGYGSPCSDDFIPLAQLYRGGSFIVATPTFTGNSIKDLITQAKRAPDTIPYASYGAGGTAHLAMEMLQDAAEIRLNHVPYRQSAMTDVASGQVTIGFEPPVSALPNIKNGRIKALAYTGDKRSTALPDVPTGMHSSFAHSSLEPRRLEFHSIAARTTQCRCAKEGDPFRATDEALTSSSRGSWS